MRERLLDFLGDLWRAGPSLSMQAMIDAGAFAIPQEELEENRLNNMIAAAKLLGFTIDREDIIGV